MQREAEKEKRRAARRREREQLGFDVDRIVKIEDASIFEKLNMQHEFQGHQADRLEIIIVGNVIRANTAPPAIGADLGMPNQFKSTANPSKPNTIEGTAAKLLMLTSIRSDQ